MSLEVQINDLNFRRAIAGFEDYLRGSRTVMIVIGRGIRDYSQETIRTGGRGNWPPLARWTVSRTGRTQPLRGTERLITYDADKDHAVVYARKPANGEWNLDMHARGYTTPARRAVNGVAMRIPQYRGKPIYLKRVGPSIVPARSWVPPESVVVDISRQAITEWVAEGARKKWR